jgi:hypothetical protein
MQARSQASRTEMLLRHSEAALGAQQDRGRQMSEKLAALERASRLSVSVATLLVQHVSAVHSWHAWNL